MTGAPVVFATRVLGADISWWWVALGVVVAVVVAAVIAAVLVRRSRFRNRE